MTEMEKQIEEMARTMCAYYRTEKCYDCRYCCDCNIAKEADRLYKAGYRKQSEGEWIIKGDYLKIMECSACGIMVASIYEKTRFCPHCGARMGGGAE